jgi:hypothetical protein
VSATAGRRFWQTRTLSLDQEDWDRLSSGLQPPERAERNELLPPLRRAVDEGLSGEQRTVFTAVTLHGVPTALAAALGSNRNAIYKALFQAGAASCAPAWQPIEEISRTFREPSGLVRPGWMICSPQTRDTECDLAFRVLDRYAEAELKGTGPESRFPGVAVHLRRCEACHQDYRGAAGRGKGLRARRVREVTDVRTPAACDGGGPGPLHGSGDYQRPPVVGWRRQMPGPAGTGDALSRRPRLHGVTEGPGRRRRLYRIFVAGRGAPPPAAPAPAPSSARSASIWTMSATRAVSDLAVMSPKPTVVKTVTLKYRASVRVSGWVKFAAEARSIT